MFRRALVIVSLLGAAAVAARFQSGAYAVGQDEREKTVHLLNRTTFGPTPQLVDEVLRSGRNAWIDRQLHPESIDTSDLEAGLNRRYPSLTMTTAQLLEEYPDPKGGPKPEPGHEPWRPLLEQSAAFITRSLESPAQLQEVLVDFWANHFNVYAADGPVRYAIVPYVRDTIRPRTLGQFEDLLTATARSAAMLYYLDNYLSMKEGYVFRGKKGGINENYARELMELHTVGVNGGYDQDDVIEVAKCFTGWTITPPWLGRGVEYVYYPPFHAPGDKTVMGHRVREGGVKEGVEVLHFLAGHPSTADFVSRKLCERFAGEAAPRSLLNRASAKFTATGGDIREVVRLILTSDEFYDPAQTGQKTKTTVEYVLSSLRATGAQVSDPAVVAKALYIMGQPLFLQRPPIGWPEQSSFWTTGGGLLNRYEFADRLVRDAITSITVNIESLGGGASGNKLADNMISSIIQRDVSTETRTAIRTAARDPAATPSMVAAVVLAAPEFVLQ